MPPKRGGLKAEASKTQGIRPITAKTPGSKGLSATHDLAGVLGAAAAEPEIDVAAAIQDCINETMAKLSEAVQERTEQLLETIASVDAMAVTGSAKRRS
jgi:hypothetical protein